MIDNTKKAGHDAASGSHSGSVSESVKRSLTQMIWSGELEQGQRLPAERALMARFGVSRSVVREAINDLASRGLLKTRPGYRPIIARPDYESVLQPMGDVVANVVVNDEQGVWNLFETRIFLEAALARTAAASARRDDIAGLQAALKRNRDAIGKRGEFEASDAAFHSLLYDIPRNPVYPVVHRAYTTWLHERWRMIQATEEIDRMNYAGHEAICQAIVQRDPDAAEQAVRRHLTAAWEYVRATFRFASEQRHPPDQVSRP